MDLVRTDGEDKFISKRICCRRLVTTVKIRSTNRPPLEFCVPKDLRRQITARRNGRSALFLVGSTLSSRTKVHSELRV
jgi:hypothetical protein